MELALTMAKIDCVFSDVGEDACRYRLSSMYWFRQAVRGWEERKAFSDEPGYFSFCVSNTWRDVVRALEQDNSPEFQAECERIVTESVQRVCTKEELDRATVGLDEKVANRVKRDEAVHSILSRIMTS